MNYLVVVEFWTYLMLNFRVCLVYSVSQFKNEMPIYKLPPPNSYIAKHLNLHQKLCQVRLMWPFWCLHRWYSELDNARHLMFGITSLY